MQQQTLDKFTVLQNQWGVSLQPSSSHNEEMKEERDLSPKTLQSIQPNLRSRDQRKTEVRLKEIQETMS